MNLTDFLPGPGRGAGFKLGQDGVQVAQGVLQQLAWPGAQPLVSCLMVTRGRLFPARFAVDCFRAQGWASRELVLVCDAPGTAIEAYCRELGDERIRLVYPSTPAASLGELRNLSLEAARGDWVCQWDDDDLYHPDRIALGMQALLALGADAMFLQRFESRAFGILLEEWLARCSDPVDPALAALAAECQQPALDARPLLAEVAQRLQG